MGRSKIHETDAQIKDRKRIAILCRTMRTALGVGQRELAEEVGLSFSAIAKLERGVMRLNAEKVSKIFDVFEQAGLTIKLDKGGFSILVSKQTLDLLNENDLQWPLYD